MRSSLIRLSHVCALAALCAVAACHAPHTNARRAAPVGHSGAQPPAANRPTYAAPVLEQLVAAAVERTSHPVQYDGSYFQIEYPNGDVALTAAL